MRRASFLLPVVAAVALLGAACVGFSEPRGWAEPVFRDGDLYVFLDREEFVALTLDEFGGQVRWYFPDDDLSAEEDIDLEAVYGPPLFAGDRIILAGFSGGIVAITPEGRFVPAQGSWWRDDVQGAIVGGAALAGERFAFGTTEQRLYVRNVADGGAPAPWPAEGLRLDGEIWSRPVVSGGVLYVGTMKGKLYAFDLATGEERWTFEAGGAIADLAVLDGVGAGDGELLFVPTLRGEVWLVDAATGSARRDSFRAEGWVWTTPAIADGVAYFGDFEGVVHAMDLASGRSLWTYETGSKVKARALVIGDSLIVGDEGGTVHFVDIAGGRLLNRVKLDGVGKIRANLVEMDGFGWVLGTDGKLFRANPKEWSVIEREVRGRP